MSLRTTVSLRRYGKDGRQRDVAACSDVELTCIGGNGGVLERGSRRNLARRIAGPAERRETRPLSSPLLNLNAARSRCPFTLTRYHRDAPDSPCLATDRSGGGMILCAYGQSETIRTWQGRRNRLSSAPSELPLLIFVAGWHCGGRQPVFRLSSRSPRRSRVPFSPATSLHPLFRWHGGAPGMHWRVSVDLVGEEASVLAECTNPEWRPSFEQWESIKRRSLAQPARLTVSRLSVEGGREGPCVDGHRLFSDVPRSCRSAYLLSRGSAPGLRRDGQQAFHRLEGRRRLLS
jgi:hypothetical protein